MARPATRAVRGGAGRRRHRASPASGTVTSVLDVARPDQRPVASRVCSVWRSPPTGDLAYVNYTDTAGDTDIAEFPVDADGAVRLAAAPRDARDRPALRQPQRRRPRVRPRRHAVHRHGRRRSRRRPGAPRAATSPRCSARCCASTRRPSGDLPYTVPADNPFVGQRRRARRDLVGGRCAIRGGSRSTPPPATCGSPTSARALSRRSTSPPPTATARRRPGLNFGWSGSRATSASTPTSPRRATTRPSTRTRTDGRCSISGGVRARGDGAGALAGWYVFGDYCTGQVFALPVTGEGDDMTARRRGSRSPTGSSVTAVRTGPDGELYVLDVERRPQHRPA